jgi:hypothetical protein
MIGRQSRCISNCLGDAEAAECFHGASGYVVALHARRLAAGAGFDHQDVDAAPGEVEGQGEADGPGAGDEHRGARLLHHYPLA